MSTAGRESSLLPGSTAGREISCPPGSAKAAPGGIFPKYIDENILTPLLSRIQVMTEHFRGVDDTFDTNAVLENVTDLMVGLRTQFGMIGENECFLIGMFDRIEKLVESALQSITAGDADAATLQPKLIDVAEQIDLIREAIAGAYTTLNAASGDPRAAPAQAIQPRSTAVPGGEQMAQLRRAVHGMDAPLKNCLLCLAAFPEGAVIKKRLLLHWWIGEKFVPSVDNGKERFQQLVDLRLIRAITRQHYDKVHSCTVHPWTRRILVGVAKINAFLEFDSDGNSDNDFARTRRPCLGSGDVLPGSGFHPKMSAMYNIDQKHVKLSSEWFTHRRYLATLQLGQWQVFDKKKDDAMNFHVEMINQEHLMDIGSCRNLRYLSLRGISGINAVPDAVGNLSKLIVLDLKACHNLQVLTKKITKLHKLQYLDVSLCYLLVEMPQGLHKMSHLQVLKGFVVASSSKKNACRLSELVSLQELRKLSISIAKMAKLEEDEYRIWENFTSLKSLRITWGVKGDIQGADNPKFSLPSSLVKLDFQCFPFNIFPGLIFPQQSFPNNLQRLYFTGGMRCSMKFLSQETYSRPKLLRLRFLKDLQNDERDILQGLQFEEKICDGQPNGTLWKRTDTTNIAAI